ncbi:MAG: HD domain-containing protein [Lachnospiraceae bacterium]|jgi:exopolyphosphatase/guanosine-5'-triphosphate,3'-diphosphate pyrophosphatase|nr:HD domain-containing protein [Lachnospiraceae bacterium]
MQIITFAAIDIGSYEVGMKIMELSQKNGIKQIDYVRHGIELGRDAYRYGKIGNEMLEELCLVLEDFTRIMKGYQVDDYRACATSAIRETKNCLLILDKIQVRTGLVVEVLSNSEQRFLGYKSIASNEESFQKIIQKGTAIVDVGGGSIQISLFDKDALVSTENLRLGTMRIRERLSEVRNRTTHFGDVIEEMINNELKSYKRLYLKDREIKHMILVGDYISHAMKRDAESRNISFSREEYHQLYQEMISRTPQEMAQRLGLESDNISLVMPALIIYKRLIEETGAETIWIPGLNLSDGLAYDYAERMKIFKSSHNFENDIVEAAKNMAKRYHSDKTHQAGTEYLALTIFDKMKRIHGMGKRERLLLRIAVLLHDCGKYISLNHTAECSYQIVMSTEIIGLSHREREIIANAIRFNTKEFASFEEFSVGSSLDRNDYLLISKLSAILRVANSMDRSHKQKFKKVRVTLKERELLVVVDTVEDITLEQGLFSHMAEFFETIFSIRPVIRQKRQV